MSASNPTQKIGRLLMFLLVLVAFAASGCVGAAKITLSEAVAQIEPVVDELRAATPAASLTAVERTEPRDCRSGLSERDGTAQVTFSYQVEGLDRAGADALVASIDRRLRDLGADVDVRREPDLDRPNLRGRRDGESYSVVFSSSDGGATATVSASTDCHRNNIG